MKNKIILLLASTFFSQIAYSASTMNVKPMLGVISLDAKGTVTSVVTAMLRANDDDGCD